MIFYLLWLLRNSWPLLFCHSSLTWCDSPSNPFIIDISFFLFQEEPLLHRKLQKRSDDPASREASVSTPLYYPFVLSYGKEANLQKVLWILSEWYLWTFSKGLTLFCMYVHASHVYGRKAPKYIHVVDSFILFIHSPFIPALWEARLAPVGNMYEGRE